MLLLRITGAYLAAVAVTYVAGAIAVSQVNLADVAALGMAVPWGHRLDAMIHDVAGMYDIYLPLIFIAHLIAFCVAGLIIRFLPGLRLAGFMLAGFAGLIAIHLLMKATLGITGVAAARSLAGLLLQGGAGAVGGFVFHRLTLKADREAPG